MYKKWEVRIRNLALLVTIVILVTACSTNNKTLATNVPKAAVAETFMFDDFNYTSGPMLESNGWKIRTEEGWPGIPHAVWKKENVSFLEDPDNKTNRLLRMQSTLGKEVSQTQICHQRKYLEGTYAARVRFTNESIDSPYSRDEVIESFYSITPYSKPLDPAYSEMDFEYLPHGGWGLPAGTLMTTTWETVQIEPWVARNADNKLQGNYQGWNILVIQVGNGTVNYLLDGQLIFTTKTPNYPDAPMSINFNLWFINNGKSLPEKDHTYIEEVDWVFHAHNSIMEPKDILQQVEKLKLQQVDFHDNVPDWDPPQDCPCNL